MNTEHLRMVLDRCDEWLTAGYDVKVSVSAKGNLTVQASTPKEKAPAPDRREYMRQHMATKRAKARADSGVHIAAGRDDQLTELTPANTANMLTEPATPRLSDDELRARDRAFRERNAPQLEAFKMSGP